MTDKQVEEALKYCPTHDPTNYCDKCALNGIMGCRNELMMKAFDTIQKLKEDRTAFNEKLLNVLEIVMRVAMEEFADKLKKICVRKGVHIDLDDKNEYYFDRSVTILLL